MIRRPLAPAGPPRHTRGVDQERENCADPGNRETRRRRLIRLTVVGCALGLMAAWGALVPLKLSGLMPAHWTWLAVIVYPMVSFGWLAALVVLMTRYPRRPLFVTYGACAVLVAVTIIVRFLSDLG